MANKLQNKLDAILEDKNTNLLPENLKAGVTCLGVEGVMQAGINTSDATATSVDIVYGKTAYVNGEKVEGSVQERTADTVSTLAANEVVDVSNSGVVYAKTTSYDIPVLFRANTPIDVEIPSGELATAIGLTADKLTKGNAILGIEGTAEAGTTGEAPRADYIVKGKVVNGVTGINYGFTPPECPSTLSVFGKADSTTGMPETITLTGYTPISWQGNSVTVEKTITEVFDECRYVAGTILVAAGDPMNWTEVPPEGVYTISLNLLFKQTPFGQLDYSNNYLMIEGYQMDMQKDTYYSLTVMKTYYDTTLEQVKTDYMEQFLASYDSDYSMIYTFWDPESAFTQGHQLEENEVAYSNYTPDELYSY